MRAPTRMIRAASAATVALAAIALVPGLPATASSPAHPAPVAAPQHRFGADVTIAGSPYAFVLTALKGRTFIVQAGHAAPRTRFTTRYALTLHRGAYGSGGIVGPLERRMGTAAAAQAVYELQRLWDSPGTVRGNVRAVRFVSMAAFLRSVRKRLAADDEQARDYLGWNNLRNENRGDAKVVLETAVRVVLYQLQRSTVAPDQDLATAGLSFGDLSGLWPYRRHASIAGTTSTGWTVSVDDLTDGYRWTYDSVTGKYTETKIGQAP